MKELKCPLCRKPLMLQTSYKGINNKELLSFYSCDNCMYQLRMSPDKDFALEYAKAFISKFPPIMRTRVGDKVIRNGGGAYKIQEINLEDMSLFVANMEEKRDALWLNQDEVALWPWELESSIQDKLEKFSEQGTRDWADVPDATKWVEDQRGIEQKGGQQ